MYLFILGVLSTLGYFLAIILSIPIYIFRYVVILIKSYFRPDLDGILDPQSACLADDLFSGKSPRSTIILRLTINGSLSVAEVKDLVWKNWITKNDPVTGSRVYPQFSQYTIKWLGFYFWKEDPNFNLDNHVHFAKEISQDFVTDADIQKCMEHQLNTCYPSERSPWVMQIVPNYYDTPLSKEPMTCVIFKCHHSVGSGCSLHNAFLDGIYDKQITPVKVAVPSETPKQNIFDKTIQEICAPLAIFFGLSNMLSHIFMPAPWTVSDKEKSWWQRIGRSELIPVEKLTCIKNKFRVSFTSVLLSAMSCAIHENGDENMRRAFNSMLCASMIAPTTVQKGLVNKSNAATFYIPTAHFKDPVKRLQTCHFTLESSKLSVSPFLFRGICKVVGCNLTGVRNLIGKNTIVSTALSNFPSALQPLTINGKSVLHSEFVAGADEGTMGVAFMAMSYNDHIRLGVTAESSLFSEKVVTSLIISMQNHIDELFACAQMVCCQHYFQS